MYLQKPPTTLQNRGGSTPGSLRHGYQLARVIKPSMRLPLQVEVVLGRVVAWTGGPTAGTTIPCIIKLHQTLQQSTQTHNVAALHCIAITTGRSKSVQRRSCCGGIFFFYYLSIEKGDVVCRVFPTFYNVIFFCTIILLIQWIIYIFWSHIYSRATNILYRHNFVY